MEGPPQVPVRNSTYSHYLSLHSAETTVFYSLHSRLHLHFADTRFSRRNS
jgi:hypothetical protein